jgi:hypothetical protein
MGNKFSKKYDQMKEVEDSKKMVIGPDGIRNEIKSYGAMSESIRIVDIKKTSKY